MEGLSTSWGYYSGAGTTRDVIEQAKEELEILEAQEPNRFNYLKLELKSFIAHLESQNLLLSSDAPNAVEKVSFEGVKSSSSVMTQESSAGKKRKKDGSENGQVMEGENVAAPKQKLQRISSISSGDGCRKRRERIDVVVERARACLHKIQQLKSSLI